MKDEVGFRLWGSDFKYVVYEIYKIGLFKLLVILWVVDYFGIDKKNIIVFGDGLNDIEMI